MPDRIMASVTLTLTDTPNGAVSVHSNFKPAVGRRISPAQAYALEVINRTHKQWGIQIDTPDGGVDIDAVHRVAASQALRKTSKFCRCDLEKRLAATALEVDANRCAACGGALL